MYRPFAEDGFALQDLVDDREVVLEQGALLERLLPDHHVHVARPVGPVLDLPALDVRDRLLDVVRHGPGLRVRHQSPGSEHAAGLPDGGHHVGRRDRGIEVDPPLDHLVHELVAADDVGPGVAGLAPLVALGEDGDPDGPSGPVRERDRAPERLILLAGVDPQPERSLDRLVELRGGERLHEADRLRRGVLLGMIERGGGLAVPFALDRGHASTSTPMLLAVPAMMRAAISTSFALRSAIFFCAMSMTWA